MSLCAGICLRDPDRLRSLEIDKALSKERNQLSRQLRLLLLGEHWLEEERTAQLGRADGHAVSGACRPVLGRQAGSRGAKGLAHICGWLQEAQQIPAHACSSPEPPPPVWRLRGRTAAAVAAASRPARLAARHGRCPRAVSDRIPRRAVLRRCRRCLGLCAPTCPATCMSDALGLFGGLASPRPLHAIMALWFPVGEPRLSQPAGRRVCVCTCVFVSKLPCIAEN